MSFIVIYCYSLLFVTNNNTHNKRIT